jgi:DNA primase
VLKRVLLLAGDGQDISPAVLLERFRGDENERTIKALFAEEKLINGELSEHEFLGAIERLKEQAKKSRLDVLLAKSNDLNEMERTELRELIK